MTTPTVGTAGAERPNPRARRHPDLPAAVTNRHGAAHYLGLGLSTLAELTAAGTVASITVGRRRLYRVSDLDAWLAGRVKGGGAA